VAERTFRNDFTQILADVSMGEVFAHGEINIPLDAYGLVPLLPLPGWRYDWGYESLDIHYQPPPGVLVEHTIPLKDGGRSHSQPPVGGRAGVGLTYARAVTDQPVLIAVSAALVRLPDIASPPRLEVRQLQGVIRYDSQPGYAHGLRGVSFPNTFLRVYEAMARFLRLGELALVIPRSEDPILRKRIYAKYNTAAQEEGFDQVHANLWIKPLSATAP
jgi:hypothetical protein